MVEITDIPLLREQLAQAKAELTALRAECERLRECGGKVWISVADALPPVKPYSYLCETSDPALVRGDGKNTYPWVAHLHVDKAQNFKTYAWGFDRDGARYTWLNPYRDISDNQLITHWLPLDEAAARKAQP